MHPVSTAGWRHRGFSAAPPTSEGFECLVDSGGIDEVRVERLSGPAADVFVLLMSGVVGGCEELGVARRATDIFGRTAACGSHEQGQTDIGNGGIDLLDLDRVLAAITRVL